MQPRALRLVLSNACHAPNNWLHVGFDVLRTTKVLFRVILHQPQLFGMMFAAPSAARVPLLHLLRAKAVPTGPAPAPAPEAAPAARLGAGMRGIGRENVTGTS